jgi:hypothetical protein
VETVQTGSSQSLGSKVEATPAVSKGWWTAQVEEVIWDQTEEKIKAIDHEDHRFASLLLFYCIMEHFVEFVYDTLKMT